MTKKDSYEYGQALKAFDRRCAICGAFPVQVHHIIYRNYGRNVKENLITLCKRHHDLAHSDQKKYVPLLIKLNETVYGNIKLADLKKHGKYKNLKFGN